VGITARRGRGRERARREGERRRQRKIARAPSGRPPTEGNELGLVPGPATYIPACWKVKTPLSLFLPIRINDSRYAVSAVIVGLCPACDCRTCATNRRRIMCACACACVCVRVRMRACVTHARSVAGRRTLPFVRSFTHRPRRVPGDSRCPGDRDRGNRPAPIVLCHSLGTRLTARGCPTPWTDAPPPRYRVA
jgi:hypothetical protein